MVKKKYYNKLTSQQDTFDQRTQIDIHQMIKQITELQNGKYKPFRPEALLGNGYDRFITALKLSPATKLRSRIHYPEELWSIPAIGLILADILILNGWEDSDDDTYRHLRPKEYEVGEIALLDKSETESLQFPELEPGFAYVPGIAYFPQKKILNWIEDARPFIEDGRLIYLPQRIIIKIGHKTEDTSIEDVPADSPWELWCSVKTADEEHSQLLIPESLDVTSATGFHQIITIAMPYLRNISLKLLYKVMNDEQDALVTFRSAISTSIKEYLKSAQGSDSPEKLLQIGAQIRRDIIDSEVSKLNQAFKKVVQVRAIKAARAALGTIGLVAAVASTGGIAAAITAALGAGGAGVLTKELADFRSDLLTLKEKSWYFAWKLKKLIMG